MAWQWRPYPAGYYACMRGEYQDTGHWSPGIGCSKDQVTHQVIRCSTPFAVEPSFSAKVDSADEENRVETDGRLNPLNAGGNRDSAVT